MKITRRQLRKIIQEVAAQELPPEKRAERAEQKMQMGIGMFEEPEDINKAWAMYVGKYDKQLPSIVASERERNEFAAMPSVESRLKHLKYLAENPAFYGARSDDEEYRSIAQGIIDLKNRGKVINPDMMAIRARAYYNNEFIDRPYSKDVGGYREFGPTGAGMYQMRMGRKAE